MKTPIGNNRNPCNILQLLSLSFTQLFCFGRGYNGNAATLLFCVNPVIVPYVEYIKNFHYRSMLVIKPMRKQCRANFCVSER